MKLTINKMIAITRLDQSSFFSYTSFNDNPARYSLRRDLEYFTRPNSDICNFKDWLEDK